MPFCFQSLPPLCQSSNSRPLIHKFFTPRLMQKRINYFHTIDLEKKGCNYKLHKLVWNILIVIIRYTTNRKCISSNSRNVQRQLAQNQPSQIHCFPVKNSKSSSFLFSGKILILEYEWKTMVLNVQRISFCFRSYLWEPMKSFNLVVLTIYHGQKKPLKTLNSHTWFY